MVVKLGDRKLRRFCYINDQWPKSLRSIRALSHLSNVDFPSSATPSLADQGCWEGEDAGFQAEGLNAHEGRAGWKGCLGC